MKTKLLAPWFVDDQLNRAKVSIIEIDLQNSWQKYANYFYLCGVSDKLSRIPRHFLGIGKPRESLFIVPRLVHFVDVTGCTPLPSSRVPKIFNKIVPINHSDHTTYWYGPRKQPFILTEPYHPKRVELEAEIKSRKLSAVILPDPGLYAGGGGQTCSVLMGLPEHYASLRDIVATLELAGWPAMPEIQVLSRSKVSHA